VLFVSAVAALLLIRSSSDDDRKRATIELVLQQRTDWKLQNARRFIASVHRTGIDNLAKFLENRASPEFDHILLVLNNYEFIASSIREGALDEGLYKRMQHTAVLKDWRVLCPFVIELRRQDKHPTLFQEIQLLTAKWVKRQLRLDV